MSRVILSPTPGLGQSQDATQGFVFYPNVTNLRGANSIEALVTVGLAQLTLIECVIGGSAGGIQFWQLQSGAADSTQVNTQIAPLDYNGATNNVHWTQVGAFGVNLMSAARVTTAGNVNIVSGNPTAITFTSATFN